MLTSAISVLLFILLLIILALLFAATVFELILNGAIIYLAGMRAFVEIERGWIRIYGFAALIAFVFLALAGNVIPLFWPFTTFVLLALLCAKALQLVMKK